MSVITAAITKADGVVLAADSEISGIYTKDKDGYCKLFVTEQQGFVFGGAGNIRPLQVIKHWTNWPIFRDYHIDIEEFVIKEVVPEIRTALFEHGALEVSKKTESFEGELIMAWKNNLVVIDSDFSVTIPSSGRYAIGSGMQEALGSLTNQGPWTKSDVIKAAQSSAITAVGVGGPIYYVTTKTPIIQKVD